MVLGKLPVPGRPTSWMIVGQGPIALALGAGGGCLDVFALLCPFSPLSSSPHLVGKRTAQKDSIIDITSDSQVNSYFPYRWTG